MIRERLENIIVGSVMNCFCSSNASHFGYKHLVNSMENADEKLNYDCFDASMLLEYIRKRQIKIKIMRLLLGRNVSNNCYILWVETTFMTFKLCVLSFIKSLVFSLRAFGPRFTLIPRSKHGASKLRACSSTYDRCSGESETIIGQVFLHQEINGLYIRPCISQELHQKHSVSSWCRVVHCCHLTLQFTQIWQIWTFWNGLIYMNFCFKLHNYKVNP